MNVAETIKALRISKNWTQAKLSEESGISRVSISSYENGNRIPHVDTYEAILNALGVELKIRKIRSNGTKG